MVYAPPRALPRWGAEVEGPYNVPAGVASITTSATGVPATLDLELELIRDANGNLTPDDTPVATGDTVCSPEAIKYEPSGGVPAGTYWLRVNEFGGGGGVSDPPCVTESGDYFGVISFNDVATPGGSSYPPRWRVFPAQPALDTPPNVLGFPGNFGQPWVYPTIESRRQTWCWDAVVSGNPVPGCEYEVYNTASRVPWDANARTGASTFQTVGNNSNAAEAWFSTTLTPGPSGYRPVDLNRNYTYPWTNAWHVNGGLPQPGNTTNETGCSQTNFNPDLASEVGSLPIGELPVPGSNAGIGNGNDISAATTNLFAMHNRMHDWSLAPRLHRGALEQPGIQLRQPGDDQRWSRRRNADA